MMRKAIYCTVIMALGVFDVVSDEGDLNESALFYDSRGISSFLNGDFPGAITNFTLAIKLNPLDSRLYSNRGNAYRASNDLTNAISDFNQALLIDPSNESAYQGRASVYKRQGKWHQAIEDCDKLEKITPKDKNVFKVRAELYELKQDFKRAIKDYRQALSLDPEDTEVLNALSWLLSTCPIKRFRNGNEAVRLATKACALTNWQKAEYIDSLAAACAETRSFEKAVRYQGQAIQLGQVAEGELQAMNERLLMYERKQPYREKN